MGDWATPLHSAVSPTPDLDLIPQWLIDKTIRHLMYNNVESHSPERDVECYEFDPQCFAPKITGINGHLAYGKQGLVQLKKTLTMSRDQNVIGQTLNTLCDIVLDPETAMSALKQNLIAQLRRLISHRHWYIRERCVQALKILALQASGRRLIVDNDDLMERLICCLQDPNSSVRNTTSDLLYRLSTNYFVVPRLMDLGFIKIIIEELKNMCPVEDEIHGESAEEEMAGQIEELEEEKPKEPALTLDDVYEMEELVGEYEEDYEPVDYEEVGLLGEPDGVYSDDNTIVTLLETLVNLMTFSTDATMDAICYDVLKLKQFLYHPTRSVRLVTWNIFKQVFSTEIGQMSLIPHKLLDDMMRLFGEETDEIEIFEIAGTLMLALVKVENRVAAWNSGVLHKILDLAERADLPSTKRLALVNVLSHLVEIPDVRSSLVDHLPMTVLGVGDDSSAVQRHLQTHLERTLWTP